VRWNWHVRSFTGSIVHSIDFFLLSLLCWQRLFYLVLCISWSFHGCLICCLRAMKMLWKYKRQKDENSAGRVYFHWFCTSVFPTSCPLRGLFSIGSEIKQLSCFPFKFALFLFFHSLLTEVATCSPCSFWWRDRHSKSAIDSTCFVSFKHFLFWLFFSDERLSALGRWEFKHWHLQRLRNLSSVPSERFSKKTSLL